MPHLRLEQIFSFPAEKVHHFFWDIEAWQKIWDPISKVKVDYDDGHHQEFTMDLEWKGSQQQIKTIRFFEKDKITFFSTQPPPLMVKHVGKWEFIHTSNGHCLVRVEREYEILESQRLGENEEVFHKQFSNRLIHLLKKLAERMS